MKIKSLVILSALILSFSCIRGQEAKPNTLVHDGEIRKFIVYVPEIYDGKTTVPLLFNFHGLGGSAEGQMKRGDMRSIADTANFILVYPQGTRLMGRVPHWNIDAINRSKADDIGFINALIDTLTQTYHIDINRIYATGKSNGGFFSFELACQLSDRIAAIGAVAATMSDANILMCNSTPPKSVLTIHGTDDRMVSYDTSNALNRMNKRANIAGIEALNQFWTNHNNTDATPIVTKIQDIDPSDNSTVELYEWKNGDQCTTVAHYKIIGGGHDWPGISGNMDINAGKVIWNFLSQFNINGKIGCK